MQINNGVVFSCLLSIFLFCWPAISKGQNVAVPDEKVGKAASEENQLIRREEEIKQQLGQLAQDQQEIQKQMMESHQAQQNLEQGNEEKNKDVADLRRRLAEAEKQVLDLRAQISQTLEALPEFVEIKARRDEAFTRRSKLLQQENALSEELVRVQIRLREIRSGSPSKTGSKTP